MHYIWNHGVIRYRKLKHNNYRCIHKYKQLLVDVLSSQPKRPHGTESGDRKDIFSVTCPLRLGAVPNVPLRSSIIEHHGRFHGWCFMRCYVSWMHTWTSRPMVLARSRSLCLDTDDRLCYMCQRLKCGQSSHRSANKMNILELMVVKVASCCPVLSRNTIVRNFTSVKSVW